MTVVVDVVETVDAVDILYVADVGDVVDVVGEATGAKSMYLAPKDGPCANALSRHFLAFSIPYKIE